MQYQAEYNVTMNAKMGTLPVLPLEVQAAYCSSHFWWPSILKNSVICEKLVFINHYLEPNIKH